VAEYPGSATAAFPRAHTVSKESEALFGEVSDDIRRAAEISAERALSPAAIREVCYGFIQVFG
jgi:hypothetical protein